MNQHDWEKTQENIILTSVVNVNITYSAWSGVQREYQTNLGSCVNGTHVDTQMIDNIWETFQEDDNSPTCRLDINGTFILDLSAYRLSTIRTIELQMRYLDTSALEKWYLKAYNWTSNSYSNNGFNDTYGHNPSGNWDYYTVNFTDKWQSYVKGDGTLIIKLLDEKDDAFRTTVQIDFLGVRIVANGASFVFMNNGSFTAHVVSLWIIDSLIHDHHDVSLFINSGQNETFTIGGFQLPSMPYFVKAVTERGNTAIYLPS